MGSLSYDTTPLVIQRIGVVGTGVMGSMLSLLFAEKAGVDVSIFDLSEASMLATAKKAEDAGLRHRLHVCKDVQRLCESLSSPKVVFFSLPHGRPGDGVVKSLMGHLASGDIIIDGSNENYLVTQKRQNWLQPLGISLVGLGVSGGFSGARNGPSLMPGGDLESINLLLPLFQKIAAKDDQGRSCVMNIGPGGSGHYVKMIHNGIEHGVMSVLGEVWAMMNDCLQMDGQEIGEVFDAWNGKGELRSNFLVAISGPICRTRNSSGTGYLLHEIRDTVVQDANNSEGTGVWANLEAVSSHVPAPSLTAAHYLRLASADYNQRAAIGQKLQFSSPTIIKVDHKEKDIILQNLHKAAYAAILSCFIQGLDLLSRASLREGWNIQIEGVLRIWRAGCIIKSDYITDLFERHYTNNPGLHPLLGDEISAEIKRCTPSLKEIVIQGISADACMPALNATLDYLKYSGSVDLLTCFNEAQLDAFGAHGYQLKNERYADASKGKHHSSWSQPI